MRTLSETVRKKRTGEADSDKPARCALTLTSNAACAEARPTLRPVAD